MTADSERYIQLQNVYKQQANDEVATVTNYVQQLLETLGRVKSCSNHVSHSVFRREINVHIDSGVQKVENQHLTCPQTHTAWFCIWLDNKICNWKYSAFLGNLIGGKWSTERKCEFAIQWYCSPWFLKILCTLRAFTFLLDMGRSTHSDMMFLETVWTICCIFLNTATVVDQLCFVHRVLNPCQQQQCHGSLGFQVAFHRVLKPCRYLKTVPRVAMSRVP